MCKRLMWKLGWLTLGLIIGMTLAAIDNAYARTPYTTTADYYNEEFLGVEYHPIMWQAVVCYGDCAPALPSTAHVLVAIETGGDGWSKRYPDYDSCVKALEAWVTKAGRGGWCYEYRGDD